MRSIIQGLLTEKKLNLLTGILSILCSRYNILCPSVSTPYRTSLLLYLLAEYVRVVLCDPSNSTVLVYTIKPNPPPIRGLFGPLSCLAEFDLFIDLFLLHTTLQLIRQQRHWTSKREAVNYSSTAHALFSARQNLAYLLLNLFSPFKFSEEGV